MSDIDWCELDNEALSEFEVDIEDSIEDARELLISPVFKLESNKLTSFEITSVLIYRSRQLDKGKQPNIDITWEQTSIEIAKTEFERRVIRLTITRCYPNGNRLTYSVDSMNR